MVPFRIPLKTLAAALLTVVCVSFSVFPGQSQGQEISKHQRIVPDSVEPKPFSTVATRQTPLYTVDFRSADQISQQDRLLLADSESTIAEHAGFAGLEFSQSNWKSRQIVCPTFPNHLFVQYTRNNGAGDVSVFSVSIPRNGNGRVRIVPIVKRGYSLFSPAPINALTISAFNHIRAEDSETANSDWLGNALCYAALAGTRPEIMTPGAEPALHRPIPALTAAMEVEMHAHGMEVLRFDDAAARPHATEWSMTFTHQGKLIKATHRPASMAAVNPASQKDAVARTWPVPPSGQN
ncbi:MAG TPA: hypothetical protein VK574_16580 [Terracidiphilus sp.]|nr:hypothetical protein [Terracidiphilus sp.]